MRRILPLLALAIVIAGIYAVNAPAFITHVPYDIVSKSMLAVIGLAAIFVGLLLLVIFDSRFRNEEKPHRTHAWFPD